MRGTHDQSDRYALIGSGFCSVGFVSVGGRSTFLQADDTDPTIRASANHQPPPVSCQQVLESSYATVKGIPIAPVGAICLQPCYCSRSGGCARTSSELAGRVAGSVFVLANGGGSRSSSITVRRRSSSSERHVRSDDHVRGVAGIFLGVCCRGDVADSHSRAAR
jgi:hypothetical protein